MEQEVAEDRPVDAGRRRRWTVEEKRSLVEMAEQSGSSMGQVAETFGIAAASLYLWRRQLAEGELDTDPPSFALVEVEPAEAAPAMRIEVEFMSGARLRIDGEAGVLLDRLVPLLR